MQQQAARIFPSPVQLTRVQTEARARAMSKSKQRRGPDDPRRRPTIRTTHGSAASKSIAIAIAIAAEAGHAAHSGSRAQRAAARILRTCVRDDCVRSDTAREDHGQREGSLAS